MAPNTPDITIRLLPQPQIPASAVNCYGLAGKVVISDAAWPELEPFRIGLPGEWEDDDLPELQESGLSQGEADRSVEGWVAEKDRLVSCRDVEDGCHLYWPAGQRHRNDYTQAHLHGVLMYHTPAVYKAVFTGKMACLRGNNRVSVRWTA